jgi:hypothetical protein
MKLNRNQLGQVFTNHETLRAFEQALNSVDITLPSTIEEANVLAGSALAIAQSVAASLTILIDALAQLEAAPVSQPQIETDDTAPHVHLGTISSQNSDDVNITGGSITGMTRNDATSVALTDDTTTNATMYPVFGTSTSTPTLKVSTTKLTWNPSTGLFSAPSVSAQFNGTLGLTTAAAAAVTTLSASGQITSTVGTGTAPFSVASATVVPNLNVSQLLGGTWAIPGAIGSTTPNTGSFTSIAFNAGVIKSNSTVIASALATNYSLPGTEALSGLIRFRDRTLGGAACFLVDPNGGVQTLGTNQITGLSVSYNSGLGYVLQVNLSSGATPRTLEWSIIGGT